MKFFLWRMMQMRESLMCQVVSPTGFRQKHTSEQKRKRHLVEVRAFISLKAAQRLCRTKLSFQHATTSNHIIYSSVHMCIRLILNRGNASETNMQLKLFQA